MFANCYSADFYCENATGSGSLEHRYPRQQSGKYGPHPAQFTGPNKRDTFKQARAAGWRIRADRCWCPGCVADMKKVTS